MKPFLFLIAFVIGGYFCKSQNNRVGIGTTAPSASARLEIFDTTKGVLLPRMTAAQRTSIVSPANGLMVYQIDGTPGFYYSNNSSWINLTEGATVGSNGIVAPYPYGSTHPTWDSLAKGINTAKVTTPFTGSNNMLAIAYGNIANNGTVLSSSSNFTTPVAHSIGSGTYVITFTSTSNLYNLSPIELDKLPIFLSITGTPSTNPTGIGFISWDATANGTITVYTYNASPPSLTDKSFSFVIYKQ